MAVPHVILYTRENCPLCDGAKRVIEELYEEIPLTLDITDIHSDDRLVERYQLMIPVVNIDGQDAFYGKVVKSDLRKRLLTKQQ